MRRPAALSCLLAAVLLTQGAGPVHHAHRASMHDRPAGMATGFAGHGEGEPSRPRPHDDHDDGDCPVCAMLRHTVAVHLEPDAPSGHADAVAYRVGPPARRRVATSPLHLHAGRDPPSGAA